jgi:hypothetical protein
MLGPDQPVVLHMLDLPKSTDALSGVRMELIDAALPLLRGVLVVCCVRRSSAVCVCSVFIVCCCALLQVSWQRATRPKRSEASASPS